jgi:hypothetical protein
VKGLAGEVWGMTLLAGSFEGSVNCHGKRCRTKTAAAIHRKMAKILLSNPLKSGTFKARSNEMTAKVKPVQPTEIKDKKIARQVIEQIRKPIPASVYQRHEKIAAYIDKVFRK